MILEWMEIRCSPVRVTNRTGRQVYDRRLVDSSRLIRTQHVATVCVSATTQRPLIGREAITYVFVSGNDPCGWTVCLFLFWFETVFIILRCTRYVFYGCARVSYFRIISCDLWHKRIFIGFPVPCFILNVSSTLFYDSTKYGNIVVTKKLHKLSALQVFLNWERYLKNSSCHTNFIRSHTYDHISDQD